MDKNTMDTSSSRHENRPSLTSATAVRDFTSFYWLKEELIAFCRANALPTNGSKIELAQRIEHFLQTGTVRQQAERRRRVRKRTVLQMQEPLSVSTIITEDYRSSQENRAFFTSIIGPRFHFTTRFMQFCKNNVGKTYQDAIDEWYSEEREKRDPTYQTTIAPQFEYNQHIRDYLRTYPDKTLKDAIDVWNKHKKRRKEQ